MLFVVEMGKVVLYLLMVVRVSSFFGYTTHGITGVYPQTTPGLVVPGNTSRHICLILCGEDINCMSIFTNGGQSCHLFYNGFVDNTVLSPGPGWNLYNVYSGGCPFLKGYVENRKLNICYKLHLGGPLDAPSFKATCASEGGEFIRITSQEIQDHIETFLSVTTSHSMVIIQGSDRISKGTFQFEDGTPMVYFNWDDNEPNDPNGDTIFIIDNSVNFKWQDGRGTDHTSTYTSSFICEVRMD
ncbi:C-type mannose receptor 2-like [Argopecten irradians]|uniref:C-type mannose receptor 2-like n=1 Tax=Argopecten irradians TaxID=31199 RepID=UPI00371AF6F2